MHITAALVGVWSLIATLAPTTTLVEATALAQAAQSQAAPSPQTPPTPAAAPAQGAQSPTAASPALVAMKRLEFLVGQWEGTGWIQTGRERATFRQQETVRTAAGGTVVVIDGLGRSLDAGRQGQVVHQAFAVVSYDAAAQAFRWRAYRAPDGNEITAQPDISTDKLVWGFEVPQGGGRVRFTITRTPAGDWFEIGELGRASGEWSQFFEMTLKRVGP